jgi:hypothetical protein
VLVHIKYNRFQVVVVRQTRLKKNPAAYKVVVQIVNM